MKTQKSSSFVTTTKMLLSGFIALSALSGGTALAHSNEHHSKPAMAEQKPWGIAGDAKKISRTIEIGMGDDLRFQPSSVDIKQNETIRFVIKNNGKMLHEMVIGTPAENAKHAQLMLKFPNMEHDEPHMAHVKAGATGEIIWTFNKAGQFEFACLVGGHYQAGMKGTFVVQPATPAPEMAEAEVRKINADTGKIMLKHGPIKNLDMPPMTMVFTVKNPALVNDIKVGDKIMFSVVSENGNYVITDIQKK